MNEIVFIMGRVPAARIGFIVNCQRIKHSGLIRLQCIQRDR